MTYTAPSAKTQNATPDRKRGMPRGWIIGIAGLCLAATLLYRTLSQYSYDELAASLDAVPAGHMLLAGAFAAASYACLTAFDYTGLIYVGHRLPYFRVALTSFTSLSLGHSIGFAGLSSGAVRYRYYARWGLNAEDVAKLVLFCGVTVALGLTILGGFALVLLPETAARFTVFRRGAIIAFGLVLLVLPLAYLGLALGRPRPLKLWRWTLDIPPPRLVLLQFVIGPINFSLVAACLHQVLLGVADVPFFQTAAAYVMANTAAMITHVPGGLGVIENVVMYLVPGANLIGPLIAYRFVYFLVPLAAGLVIFAVSEFLYRRSG